MNRKPGTRRRHLAVALGLFVALAGCAGSARTPTAAAPATPAPVPPTPRQVFAMKCSRCHELENAYSVISHRETWIKNVATMAAKDFAWINSAHMRIIITYHDDHPAVVADLFARKCAPCHEMNTLRQMDKTATQWKTMVTFMGSRAPGGLTREEAEMLRFALLGG